MDSLDIAQIEALLKTKTFGRNLIVRRQLASTNDLVKELALKGAPAGTTALTEEQTAGRGRLARRWLAPPGSCVLCSVLFRPNFWLNLPSIQASWMTMICSLAVADAVSDVAKLDTALKWPNDLIIPGANDPLARDQLAHNWRKLAGVLTETGFTGGRLDFVVVGIGINVNVQPEMLPRLAPNAASILAETGQTTDRAALIAAMLNGIEARYERLRTGETPHAEWSARLATLGRQVQVRTSERIITGIAEGIDESGALLLRTLDGEHHTLTVGDVTLAHAPGE